MNILGDKFKVNRTTTSQTSVKSETAHSSSQIVDHYSKVDTENQSNPLTSPSSPIESFMPGMTSELDASLEEADFGTPRVDDILVNNPKTRARLDVLIEKYEKHIERIKKEITSKQQSLARGEVTGSEASVVQRLIERLERELDFAQRELAKAQKLNGETDDIVKREKLEMRDINGDSWIGRAFAKDSFRIVVKDDGTKVFFNHLGNRVPSPVSHLGYEAKIFDGNGIIRKAASTPADSIDEDYKNATLIRTQLNGHQPTYSSKFGTQINIRIPEYVWVKRELNKDSNFELYDKFDANGKQETPAKLDDYIQIPITKVDGTSIPSQKAKDGTQLWDHVFEFIGGFDGDEIVAFRMTVEGVETSKTDDPAAAKLANGRRYIAASNVGLSISGEDRLSAGDFNFSQIKSTSRHTVKHDKYMTETGLGGKGPAVTGETKEDRRAAEAWVENIQLFVDRPDSGKKVGDIGYYWHDQANQPRTSNKLFSEYTSFANARDQGWYPIHYNDDHNTLYHDAYISSKNTPRNDPHSPLLNITNGPFIYGLSGVIEGSQTSNNTIIVDGKDKAVPSHLENFVPKDRAKLDKADPAYKTSVRGGNGHDVVVMKGEGDLVVESVSFFWREGAAPKDQTIISTKQGDGRSAWKNPKNYVHIDGGVNYIYNPVETASSHDNEAIKTKVEGGTTHTEMNTVDYTVQDDYYHIVSGSASFANGVDLDLPEGYDNQQNDSWWNENTVGETYINWSKELNDQRKQIPEETLPDELKEEFEIGNGDGAYAQLTAEVDSFFGEWGEDAEGALGEFDDAVAERDASRG